MTPAERCLSFVLAATDQGSLIVNRLDFAMVNETQAIGVGGSLLATGSYDAKEASEVEALLGLRREHHGDGVVAVDCGSNIGVFAVQWAKAMTGWGSVLAIEAQERIFYALAGNIALNNCMNARALHAAVGATAGVLEVPTPNYGRASTFGSLELVRHEANESIGQPIDYENGLRPIPMLTVDGLCLPRLDLIKIDVERMENEVMAGAEATILRCKPIIVVETLKCDVATLGATLDAHGYRKWRFGGNFLAIHEGDPVLQRLLVEGVVS